jgi:hypothetical protein
LIKVDQAVDEQLGELDWNRVFEICQLVNQNELGAKEARKQLQKKLMSSQPRLQVMCLEVGDKEELDFILTQGRY